MKWFTLVWASLALGVAPTAVLAADAEAITAATAVLQSGAFADSHHELIQARGELERLSAAEPDNALLHYYVALADWRLVPRLDDKKKAKQYCKDGLARCDKALEIDPEFAEAVALKVGLQGLSIQFNPMSGMILGPEMEKGTKRSVELAPENPRVHFLDALNTMHKPSFVGGGAKNAMPKFAKAHELFEAEEPGDGAAPSWGFEDACLWAGRCAMKLEDYETARLFYQRVLTINPDNEWVRNVLLPEAEEKLGDKDKS